MAGYVVKDWYVSEQPNESGQFISISSRAPGLMSALLSMMGLDATASLQANHETIIFEESSMNGHLTQHIPLSKVTSVTHGFAKPFREAIAMGIVLGLATFGIGIVVALIYYFISKTVTVTVQGSGGINATLDFKASGGVTPEQAAQLAHFIYQLRNQAS